MNTNDIDNALSDLRQMTILGLRVLDGMGEVFRRDYEEASEALSFCLHDMLERIKKLEGRV
ncbi:hypothetical protein [Bradyrhizobium zhanjiangense]|uniref:Uncharacterized protein n=1 Tax=Bradyrhizobium zhanjiangense TaxID=1325107 RepID=A0ABY0DQG4_9BRAD|nr:hypothetical protein [Bradyrhizobium zhanjiangense]RXG96357.1 hypothetical protein EAS62_12255 [Bradyrhizobium zhanjiangense]